jgi:acid stress-induced BolA-like protein IbaG/YrbA
MDLQEKVTRILENAFHPERIILEDDADGMIGYLISSRFSGMDSIERQGLIYDALRAKDANLSKAELRHILAISPVTPEEYAVHSAD